MDEGVIIMLGERLRRFRVARGMSLGDLEATVDGLVSSQTLSKYERGKLQPTATTLNQIASALGVKSAQLWSEPPCHVKWIAFRKHARLGKREQERIQSFVAEEFEKRVQLQEQICEGNTVELPVLSATVRNLDDAEEAALGLRSTLNLGIDPIANLIDVLEDHYIHIIEVDASEAFDGISAVARDTDDNLLAAAIATRSGVPGDRQRLNITHELGHLILDLRKDIDPEKAAFRFGAAFLAPAEQLRRDVGEKRNRIQKDELFYLKKRYGMSIQAMLFRLKDLRIITETYYRQWCIQINKFGWKKCEPIEILPEKPERFHQQVLRALSEELITETEADQLLNHVMEPSANRSLSERRQFLELPKEERDRILSEQAKEMADFYENDTEWREWEGGPVVEYDTP
jgi:Zn-dependent peptidase ImmA (M78 family)/transcriptional regulator with XRE-family HTH domain